MIEFGRCETKLEGGLRKRENARKVFRAFQNIYDSRTEDILNYFS